MEGTNPSPQTQQSGTQPVSRFKSVSEDLLCAICRKVPLSPMLGTCEHICCPSCIEHWLRQAGTCPVCGREMSLSELRSPGRIIQELYRKLEICCDYYDRGCAAWVRLSDWAEHVNACPKAPARCANEGCEAVVNRDQFDEHVATKCEHRLVYCELCQTLLPLSGMKTHRSTACPRGEVECSCGAKMLRADKPQHLLNDCRDRALVTCPVPGCGQSVAQGELSGHISGSLGKHLQLLTGSLKERDSTVLQLQQELSRVKTAADATTKKLSEAKSQLQTLQSTVRDLTWYGMGSWRYDQENRALWTFGNVNQRLKEATLKKQSVDPARMCIPFLIWSPQFYTHKEGYRFSLRIDLGSSPNVGLFVHLHQGEHDDRLHWPFNLDYTVQLGTVVSHITQRDSYMHYTSQGRPPHEFGWGWALFCGLDALKEAISNDSLTVAIHFYSTSMPAPSQSLYHIPPTGPAPLGAGPPGTPSSSSPAIPGAGGGFSSAVSAPPPPPGPAGPGKPSGGMPYIHSVPFPGAMS
eukprot:RCo033254